jgi:hypothetical protein
MMGVVWKVTVFRLASAAQGSLLSSGMLERTIRSAGAVILMSNVALMAGSSQQGKACLPHTEDNESLLDIDKVLHSIFF